MSLSRFSRKRSHDDLEDGDECLPISKRINSLHIAGQSSSSIQNGHLPHGCYPSSHTCGPGTQESDPNSNNVARSAASHSINHVPNAQLPRIEEQDPTNRLYNANHYSETNTPMGQALSECMNTQCTLDPYSQSQVGGYLNMNNNDLSYTNPNASCSNPQVFHPGNGRLPSHYPEQNRSFLHPSSQITPLQQHYPQCHPNCDNNNDLHSHNASHTFSNVTTHHDPHEISPRDGVPLHHNLLPDVNSTGAGSGFASDASNHQEQLEDFNEQQIPSGVYEPELDDAENPFYFSANRMLYEAHVSRLRRHNHFLDGS